MKYYNPTTNQCAIVLGVDDRTGIAHVCIDDEDIVMDWQVFIGLFYGMVSDEQERLGDDLGY